MMPSNPNMGTAPQPAQDTTPQPSQSSGMSQDDADMFNSGDCSPEDFQAGNYGMLDIGDMGGNPGETVNFMAQGMMDKNGKLKVNNMYVLGSPDTENSQDSQESPGMKAMGKLTGEQE